MKLSRLCSCRIEKYCINATSIIRHFVTIVSSHKDFLRYSSIRRSVILASAHPSLLFPMSHLVVIPLRSLDLLNCFSFHSYQPTMVYYVHYHTKSVTSLRTCTSATMASFLQPQTTTLHVEPVCTSSS